MALSIAEEIALCEQALSEMPIGISETRDAAGNIVKYDRAGVQNRLDKLRAMLAVENGVQSFSISKLESGSYGD